MPPHFKQKRPHTHGKKSGHSSKHKAPEPATGFSTSRTVDVEYVRISKLQNHANIFREEPEDDLSSEENVEDGGPHDDDNSSDEGETATSAQSYMNLLEALKTTKQSEDRPMKRRKLENGSNQRDVTKKGIKGDVANPLTLVDGDEAGTVELAEEADNDTEAHDAIDSDEDDFILQDPFEHHYANVVDTELDVAIERLSRKSTAEKTSVGKDVRKHSTLQGTAVRGPPKKSRRDLKLKKKLVGPSKAVIESVQAEEIDILNEMFSYKDILCASRSFRNAARYRDCAALHALNHIFKTRDKVLKNNARLAQDTAGDAEYRDQGFTRPKVLVLLPTKQACVRFIDSIVKISEPDQQENRGRLLDTFSLPEDDSFENKPEDFRELFGGNHEEDFRAGLKFTRKTIKFFSGFYNSDIIIASPLGLMRTITTGGGAKDKKGHDADFLSSIEIVIMDHANALEMQNWQHVDYVFSQLNLLPKESHGCDFARARNWYLDGKAKYLRQTVILSDYLTPSILSLASTYLHNIAGRVKYTPTYIGAMLNTSPSMPLTVTQSFLRFESTSPHTDSDVRFKFFTTTILPNLLRSSNKAANKGTLIFVPTYLDFVRLRNHFSTATETTNLSFGTISEYSTRGDVARARSHFFNGRHSILLYTERAHHYFRYRLKGIRRLVFYGVPENPVFWTEMIEALSTNAQHDLEWAQSQKAKQGKGLVRAMFSKWDVMKLERIVGTERVARLVSDREGDVFDFL